MARKPEIGIFGIVSYTAGYNLASTIRDGRESEAWKRGGGFFFFYIFYGMCNRMHSPDFHTVICRLRLSRVVVSDHRRL
jgi:hypothetical protein